MVMAKKKVTVDSECSDAGESIPLSLRLPKSLLARLDTYRHSQRFPPTRQVVVERLLEDFLCQQENQKEE